MSISKYEQNIAQFKKEGQSIFNLSENSAFIEGVDFVDIDDFGHMKSSLLINRIELFENIKKLSEYGLLENEINKLENIITKLNHLKSFIERILNSNYSKNIHIFNTKLEKIFIEIIDTKDFVCSNLLVNYFNFSLPYVYSSLNDEKIKNKTTPKYLRSTEEVLLKHLIKILDTYLFYLSNVLK